MIEEPYRWVEAIANRREYIEHQLAAGSPVVALSYNDGILLLTLGRERQKIFEIYDRIAMAGIGHPGDVERLRMAALEVASTEGFTRSAADVSLRRLANYSLSPALKAAFEQIYGPPYLARLLFAELGANKDANVFARLDYDGAIHTNGGGFSRPFQRFGTLAGTVHGGRLMDKFLEGARTDNLDLSAAARVALDAWTVGHWAQRMDEQSELPTDEVLAAHRAQQLKETAIEAAVLERNVRVPVTFRVLQAKEVDSIVRERA